MRRRYLTHTGLKHDERPAIYFITICAKFRAPIFANDRFHALLLDAWANLPNQRVGRYVIMPDHIHFFCTPNLELDSRLRPWISALKSHITRNWPDRPVPKPWLTDFWDTQMRSTDHYMAKVEYVLQNPVRAGLVQEADAYPFKGALHDLTWDQ